MQLTTMRYGARSFVGMAGVGAAAIGLTLALAGTPAQAATSIPVQSASATISASQAASHAPRLTVAELQAVRKLVSTKRGREEFYSIFEHSFGRVAVVRTGKSPAHTLTSDPGSLNPDLTWGLSGSGGEHFWIIASYADILSGALIRATPYCVAGLGLAIDPAAAVAVCGGVVYAIDRLAAGHSPLGNHGVWAEVHFWPFWTGVYTW